VLLFTGFSVFVALPLLRLEELTPADVERPDPRLAPTFLFAVVLETGLLLTDVVVLETGLLFTEVVVLEMGLLFTVVVVVRLDTLLF
jgi:hypothetical protein